MRSLDLLPALLLSVLLHAGVISFGWQQREAAIFLKQGGYAIDVTFSPGLPGAPAFGGEAPRELVLTAAAPELKALLPQPLRKFAPVRIAKGSLRRGRSGGGAEGQAGAGEGGGGGSGGVSSPAVMEGSAYPDYPAYSRRLGQEGRVVYEVHISREGKLKAAKLISSSRFHLLDEAARRALEEATYRPAMRGFQAVDAVKRIAFVFKLNG